MINFTIRTINSGDYTFSVDDKITVKEVKETVMEKTGVHSSLQLLIFCGKVLQDDKQLGSYGVNDKVIHMAKKTPPSAEATEALQGREGEGTSTSSSTPEPIQPQEILYDDLPGLELSPTASRLVLLRQLITEITEQIEALRQNQSDARNNIEPPSGSSRQSRGQSFPSYSERQMDPTPYHTPPADFGEIVDQLHNLDAEFAPFRELYVRTLRQVNNPQFQLEEAELQRRQRNAEISAEVFHSFSHAYHLVSNIILLMSHQNSRLTSQEFPVETHISILQSPTDSEPGEARSSSSVNINVRPDPFRYQVEMEAIPSTSVDPNQEEQGRVLQGHPLHQTVCVMDLVHDRFLPCDSQHARRQLQRRREDTRRAGGPRLRDSSRGRAQTNVVTLFDSLESSINSEEAIMVAAFVILREATAITSRTLVPTELSPLRRLLQHHMRVIMQRDYEVGTQVQLAELIFARHAVFIARIQLITPIRRNVDLVESMRAVLLCFLNEAMMVLAMENNSMFSRRSRIVYPRMFYELCGVLSYCCLEGIEGLRRIYRSFISDLIQNIDEPVRDLLYGLGMENLNTAIRRIEANEVHCAQFVRRKGSSQGNSSASSQSEAMQRSPDNDGTLQTLPNTPTTFRIVSTVTTFPNVSTYQIPTRTPIVRPTAPITPSVSMMSSTRTAPGTGSVPIVHTVPMVPTIFVRSPTPVSPIVPTSPAIPSIPIPRLLSPQYIELSGAFAIASNSNQVQSSATAYPREMYNHRNNHTNENNHNNPASPASPPSPDDASNLRFVPPAQIAQHWGEDWVSTFTRDMEWQSESSEPYRGARAAADDVYEPARLAVIALTAIARAAADDEYDPERVVAATACYLRERRPST